MTHLPADHFLKPILRALGVPNRIVPDADEPYPPASMAICGVESPTTGRSGFRPKPNARFLGDDETFFTAGERSHGYFAQERMVPGYRNKHDKAEFEPFPKGTEQTRWFLWFRDDGRKLADHIAAIDCPSCLVTLDQLMEKYGVTVEIYRPGSGQPRREFADHIEDAAPYIYRRHEDEP